MTFYMLYQEGGGLPLKKHEEIATAKIEAERLVNKENRPVYILKTVAMAAPRVQPVQWVKFDKPEELTLMEEW